MRVPNRCLWRVLSTKMILAYTSAGAGRSARFSLVCRLNTVPISRCSLTSTIKDGYMIRGFIMYFINTWPGVGHGGNNQSYTKPFYFIVLDWINKIILLPNSLIFFCSSPWIARAWSTLERNALGMSFSFLYSPPLKWSAVFIKDCSPVSSVKINHVWMTIF